MIDPKTAPIPDGGPAFPIYGNKVDGYNGMTLRDYFAAKAMQGMLADGAMCGKAAVVMCENGEYATKYDVIGDEPFSIAEECYKVADAMLAARAKRAAQ